MLMRRSGLLDQCNGQAKCFDNRIELRQGYIVALFNGSDHRRRHVGGLPKFVPGDSAPVTGITDQSGDTRRSRNVRQLFGGKSCFAPSRILSASRRSSSLSRRLMWFKCRSLAITLTLTVPGLRRLSKA